MTTTTLTTAAAGTLEPQQSPDWVVPATPEPELTIVGISHIGELYIYGETPDQPGPLVPAIIALVRDIRITQHGSGSRYGLRDYLELKLQTPLPDIQVILRLPCRPAPHPVSGDLLIPWSVRSLLASLQAINLSQTAVKLQTRRGQTATFFRVFPFSPQGEELPEIRCEAIGGSRHDLEIAVDHLRGQLGLPPLFPAIADSTASPQHSSSAGTPSA